MSTQNSKTRAWEEIQLVRDIRPYRMAVIQIGCDGVNAPTYSYVFNEFGSSVVTGVTRTSQGVYSVALTSASFKNTELVTASISLAGSTADPAGVSYPLITSSINTTFTTVFIKSIDMFTASTALDVTGKIILVIKEYYAAK
jgi:hypothetical protein